MAKSTMFDGYIVGPGDVREESAYVVKQFFAFRTDEGEWVVKLSLANQTKLCVKLPATVDQSDLDIWRLAQQRRPLMAHFVGWLVETAL